MIDAWEIEATADRVAAWSDFRLPFEPKGEARTFRDQLRLAIRRLARRPALHAEYISADCSTCDVENVLLYNVGGSPFTGVATEALVVERRHAAPPPAPAMTPRAHFVEYRSVASPTAWRAWRRRRTLASWSGAPVNGPLAAATVWASMKAGRAEVVGRWDGSAPIGVTARIATDRPIALVSSVKALLDGIVAAGHAHEGGDLADLAALVAARLHMPLERPLGWLTDHGGAVLGSRRLLVARAGGVQWNPADDSLAAITIERSPTPSRVTSVECELFELEPASMS